MKQKARYTRSNYSTHLVTNQISIFLQMKTAENCGFGIGPSSGKELFGAGQKVEGEGGGVEENGGWVSKFRAFAKGGSPQFSTSGGVGHDNF